MIKIYLSLIIFFFSFLTFACDSTLLVHDIYLSADETVDQEEVILTGEEAQSILCKKNKTFDRLIYTANKRLKAQQILLEEFNARGLLSPKQYSYYFNFFLDLKQNIDVCENSIAQLQSKSFPQYTNRASFDTKPNGVTHCSVYKPVIGEPHNFFTHIIWLGKLLRRDQLHLCEVEFNQVDSLIF